MLPYQLTLAAESDLKEIARHTLERWGKQQAKLYADKLEACFQSIGEQKSISRKLFPERFPHVEVVRCEHHYVFYLFPETTNCPRIFAVLHENMDLIARLKERLN